MAGSEPKKSFLERVRKARFVAETGRTYRLEIISSTESVYAEA